MKNLLLLIVLLSTLFLGVSKGQQQPARLTIETIPGYNFPTKVYPTLPTSPAEQMNGVLVEDVVDIRVFPSANPQSEVHASINKLNSDNILFSSNTNFGLSQYSMQGYYVSTDGGQSWFGDDILPNNGLGAWRSFHCF